MLPAVIVDDAGQCHVEARQMRAAVRRVDVVDERKDVLGIRIVVLHGDLDARRADQTADIDRFRKENFLALVDELDELADAALVVEYALLRLLRTLVAEDDADAAVEERHLAEAGLQHVILKFARFKDAVRVVFILDIGPEADGRAGAVGLADDLQVIQHLAALIFLLVDFAVLIDVDLHMAGQRVNDRRAHAMQTAGYLVSSAAELAARMQDGQADLDSRTPNLGMNADRKAASVVLNGAGAVFMQRNDDFGAEARQCFIHRVIDDFVYQMMQTALVR